MEKDASKKTAMFARGINNLFIYATCIVSAVGKRLGRGVRSGREAGGGEGGVIFFNPISEVYRDMCSPGNDSQISPNDTDPEIIPISFHVDEKIPN